MKKSLWISLIAWVLAAGVAQALPEITSSVTPGTISYQGRMQDETGEDYSDGVYEVEFRIYDTASAGTPLWGAVYKPYLYNGFFSVILGQTDVGESAVSGCTYTSVSDLWKAVWMDPNSVNKERYLSIKVIKTTAGTVADPQESFPRQQLLASPFAIQAQFAQQSSGDFKVSGDLEVTGNMVNSGGAVTMDDSAAVNGAFSVNATGAEEFSLSSSGGVRIYSDANGEDDLNLTADDLVNVKASGIVLEAVSTINLGTASKTPAITAYGNMVAAKNVTVGGTLTSQTFASSASGVTIAGPLTATGETFDLSGSGGVRVFNDANDLNLQADDSIFFGTISVPSPVKAWGPITAKSGVDVTGDLTMGSHTISHVVEATATQMRMVAGRVNDDGSKDYGTGFLVSRTGEGTYVITFSSAFSEAPVVVVSGWGPIAETDNFCTAAVISTSGFTVKTKDDDSSGTADEQDGAFSFMAMGTD